MGSTVTASIRRHATDRPTARADTPETGSPRRVPPDRSHGRHPRTGTSSPCPRRSPTRTPRPSRQARQPEPARQPPGPHRTRSSTPHGQPTTTPPVPHPTSSHRNPSGTPSHGTNRAATNRLHRPTYASYASPASHTSRMTSIQHQSANATRTCHEPPMAACGAGDPHRCALFLGEPAKESPGRHIPVAYDRGDGHLHNHPHGHDQARSANHRPSGHDLSTFRSAQVMCVACGTPRECAGKPVTGTPFRRYLHVRGC